MVPIATSVFMFASPWRAPLTAATRNRRPKTNCTTVAGTRNQRFTSIIGHGVPPGQNMMAIIARPMPSEANAWKRRVRRSAAWAASTASVSSSAAAGSAATS